MMGYHYANPRYAEHLSKPDKCRQPVRRGNTMLAMLIWASQLPTSALGLPIQTLRLCW